MSDPSGLVIRAVRARGVDLALARPVETAAGVMRTAPLVLVDLDTEAGITGRSYVRCYTPIALDPLARLIVNLEELVKGDPAEPAWVEDKLQRHFRLLGPQGLTGIAIAAIDMALWDVCAKAAGVPLVTLLGGRPTAVPTYASLRSMRPASAAGEAEELAARGFTAVKLKLGGGDLDADLAAIRAVHDALGDGVDLLVDYNQSLSVDEAVDRVRVLDDQNLYWIEEPTRADDYDGHARIAAAAATPIQLGENWWGPNDMAKSLAAHASDHVTLDVMKLGGISGWRRAAALAESAGLPASSHTFPELSAHLLAVTPTAHRLEYLDHAGPILTAPVRIEAGHAWPTDQPGSGLEWNEELIGRLLAR